MRISRRAFVGSAVAVGAGMALGQLPGIWRSALAAQSDPTTPSVGMLYDVTQCVGCRLCEVACLENKGLTPDKALLTLRKSDPGVAPKGTWAARRQQCLHCISPGCVSACPFGVPKFDWNSGVLDKALIRKCDFCYDRQQKGLAPACVAACPTKAAVFGDRATLLARAKDLIARHPGRYVSHIFGEHEAGGTSMLMIAGVPFEKLGLPQPGTTALPALPNKVMGMVLPFAAVWAATLTGITAATRMRERTASKTEPPEHASRKEEP